MIAEDEDESAAISARVNLAVETGGCGDDEAGAGGGGGKSEGGGGGGGGVRESADGGGWTALLC